MMSCFALITSFLVLNKAKKTEEKYLKQYKDFINLEIEKNKLTRLIPTECLKEISKVLDHGAKKYSPNGWKEKINRVIEPLGEYEPIFYYAMKSKSHVAKFQTSKFDFSDEKKQIKYCRIEGDPNEKESGCHHLAHAIVNLMFAYWHDIQATQRLKFIGKNNQN